MHLWRLASRAFADIFDGGYGLIQTGRWNSLGRAVTYCATSPSLCVLEKLVHVDDPDLLPPQVMLQYEVPDNLVAKTISVKYLPEKWREMEGYTQGLGDEWHLDGATPLLSVPSSILPLAGCPDVNVIINHNHADVGKITRISAVPFDLDSRLL